MTQISVPARRLAIVLACVLASTIGVTDARGDPPFVIHQTFDGVQVDSSGTPPGSPAEPILHLGAFEAQTVLQPSHEVTRVTDIVLVVGEEECFEVDGGWFCRGIWDATCVPATSDMLQIGPTPVRAAMRGTFDCTRGDGSTFPLNVDLVWSGDLRDLETATFPWHPAGVPGAFAGVRVLAQVTGSVSDGTLEYLPADAEGTISHFTDTQVFVP